MATIVNNLVRRYSPTCRNDSSVGFGKESPYNPKYESFGDSITDKEAYRLSLVGGVSGAGSVSFNPGAYMFPDGKYDPTKDISYVLRPDLSQVQIDEYLKSMEMALESSDKKLEEKINKDIETFKNITSSNNSDVPNGTSPAN